MLIANAQLKMLANQVYQFQEEQGRLPESLQDLLMPGGPLNVPYIKDPYVLINPWGYPFQYDRTDPNQVVIWCQLPNGEKLSSESWLKPD